MENILTLISLYEKTENIDKKKELEEKIYNECQKEIKKCEKRETHLSEYQKKMESQRFIDVKKYFKAINW